MGAALLELHPGLGTTSQDIWLSLCRVEDGEHPKGAMWVPLCVGNAEPERHQRGTQKIQREALPSAGPLRCEFQAGTTYARPKGGTGPSDTVTVGDLKG